jgi:mannose-6-phosphate isomerase class I
MPGPSPASSYDRYPFVPVTARESDCALQWPEIGQTLQAHFQNKNFTVMAVELYPGCDGKEISARLAEILQPDLLLHSEEALLPPEELEQTFALGNDPVFAFMQPRELSDFFRAEALNRLREQAQRCTGRVIVVGTGATLVAEHADCLVYADLARWEIQRRQRAHRIGNLGLDNANQAPAVLYKRAYFLDWRAADRTKSRLLPRIDFLLDTNHEQEPKLISGEHFRLGLRTAVQQPFRVVPFFDAGPWGGQWMKQTFDLPSGTPNYAWGFDCVPEENSLLLGFGSRRVEIPALDLVLFCPNELLGKHVVKVFGSEFPIRFDFLDTMAGGNLSLQVHPLRKYIRETFGMDYTQDESYYMLQAADDCAVYLGLKEGIDRDQMAADLRQAQRDPNAPFDANKYVNAWPAKKHDHFLIPAGTIHCSGQNGVVLEISATPYIFTFKLWDWGRLGLDGKPRPIHLDHGLANIQWDRTTSWVRKNLINAVSELDQSPGWREETTGLHELEFIETRRHWFTAPVPHHTNGTVNVLNLVEGDQAVVESPAGAFAPFTVRYGETFIVPAQVGPYTIRPEGSPRAPLGTIKAFIRPSFVGLPDIDQETLGVLASCAN